MSAAVPCRNKWPRLGGNIRFPFLPPLRIATANAIHTYIYPCILITYRQLALAISNLGPGAVPSASRTPELRHLSPFRRLPCRPPSPGDPLHYSGITAFVICPMTRLMMILTMHLILYMYWFPCRGHQNRMQPDCSIYIWEALLLLAPGSLHWFVVQCHYSGRTG